MPEDKKFVSESEFKKVVEQRDKLKEELRAAEEEAKKAKRELKILQEKMQVREKAEEELKQRMSELEEKLNQYQEKEEEEKMKEASEIEKLKIQHEREIEKLKKEYQAEIREYEKKIKELESGLNSSKDEIFKLRRYQLESRILHSAYNIAKNPKRIVKLCRDDFVWDEENGDWYHVKETSRGNVIKVPVEEYIKKFLEDPENADLVKVKINEPVEEGDKGKKKEPKEDLSEIAKKYTEEELKHQAEIRNMTIEDLKKLLQLQEEAKKKRKEQLKSLAEKNFI
ncbi:hypothetical protein J7J62_04060 [bacterium]|nr:hypothetical protein [bacterium]